MLEDAGGGKAKRGSIERDDTRSVRVANIDPALTTTMHHNGQQQPLVSSTSFPHLASTSSSFLSFYFFVFFSFIDFLLSFLVSFPLVPLVNSLVSSAPLVRRRGIGRFASSPFVCRRDDVCRPLPPPLPLRLTLLLTADPVQILHVLSQPHISCFPISFFFPLCCHRFYRLARQTCVAEKAEASGRHHGERPPGWEQERGRHPHTSDEPSWCLVERTGENSAAHKPICLDVNSDARNICNKVGDNRIRSSCAGDDVSTSLQVDI